MNILVTGGAGFIGSHFVDRFLSEGNRVWALDSLRGGSAANLSPDAEFVQMDLNDPALGAKLGTVMAQIRCGAVFHLAAQASARASCLEPIFDATENIIATLRLLETCLESGTRYFCFASGAAVYGEAGAGPQTEERPEAPVSPHGAAKLAVDKYLHAYSVQRGLRSSGLRFSNAYGPRQGENGAVAVFSRLLREGRPPRVNGDGLQTRDFVYVADLAEAASLALRQEATGVFNLGTGLETSILDLARALCLMADADPGRVEHGPAVPGERRRSAVDPSKAAKVLAWSPRTSLASGLRATYEWYAAWKDRQ
jgi:UDP-glucose 4-epimerase